MSAQRRWTGHVVVCGTGGVGLRTIEQLHGAGVEVVAVVAVDPAAGGGPPDPVARRLLADWGVPVEVGRPQEALVEAGVAGAAAVVCVPGSDLMAVQIALLARQARPDVRLVVRLDNPAVGRALAEVTGEGSVLDVAALAAPSVVEACLGARQRPVRLAGRDFLVAALVAERDGTLRELYGPLAPLAVTVPSGHPDPPGGPAPNPAGGPAGDPAGDPWEGTAGGPVEGTAGGPGAGPEADPVICPGRDHRVRAGARVTLIGTPDQFAGHPGLEPDTGSTARVRYAGGARGAGAARAAEVESAGGRPGLITLLRSLAAESDRPLRATLLILLALFVVSVVVLRLGYVKPDGTGMTVLDAAYFTVETIGTIGYGDFYFASQAPWLRVFAIVLMLLGAVLAAIWFALLTELLISRRIGRSFDQRRVGAMKGHVIVIGLGAVGVGVAEGLHAAGRRVVVVERDEANRHLPRARELGVPVIFGDATDQALLASVNLGSAAAVAVLTSNDLVNIEAGLAVRGVLARRWTEVPVVLRVFDRELGDAIAGGFGFRSVRSTAALAAPWFVGAALGLRVLGTFYVERTPFMIGRIAVAAGSGLDGLAMGELSARTRVVALERAPDARGVRVVEHPPRSGTRFGAGDHAYLVGPYEELLAVLRRDALDPAAAARVTAVPSASPAGIDRGDELR